MCKDIFNVFFVPFVFTRINDNAIIIYIFYLV